jgi:hypothetical protein
MFTLIFPSFFQNTIRKFQNKRWLKSAILFIGVLAGVCTSMQVRADSSALPIVGPPLTTTAQLLRAHYVQQGKLAAEAANAIQASDLSYLSSDVSYGITPEIIIPSQKMAINKWEPVTIPLETGAACGDGSPYRLFLFRKPGATNTIVLFEDGGACTDEDSCNGKGDLAASNPFGVSEQYFNSINGAKKSITAGPILSSSSDFQLTGENPNINEGLKQLINIMNKQQKLIAIKNWIGI